jgi:hypothetical protein
MRPCLHRAVFAVFAFAASSGLAQMHKVAKPQQVVRAVGVYEWTGDFAKPNASRLIPVSLYIDGHFQDAGIYTARPVPFALLSGNVYELQSAGIGKGLLDLVYARHLQTTDATGDLAYDDGWFGYGKVQPLAIPRRSAAALKPSKNLPVLQSSVKDTAAKSSADTSADPDRPTMKRRDNSTASTASSGTTSGTNSTTSSASPPADDPDRPVMKRRDSSSGTTTDTTSTTANTPADDPDRPTMKRRSSDGSTSDSSNTGSSGTTPASTTSGPTTASSSDPASDPDRPTLKRRTPEEARKAHNANDGPSTTGYDSLNNDPNRPTLHYGKPTHALTETDLPKLTGLPQNLRQMVAVSDAVNRDPHPFALEWEDAAQHAAVLQKMQAMAEAQLATYKTTVPPPPAHPAKTTVSAAKTRHAAKPTPPPPIALMDEELKGYTLSYGGAATYIYSAHTAGTGAALRYVTIVAQDNGLGELKPAIQSVTDAAHLDDTPLMRFVDTVDAEASNRASLLFELRGQSARQFGLYRVIAAHADRIFLTGTTE